MISTLTATLVLPSCVKLDVEANAFAGKTGLPVEIDNCPGCSMDEQPLRGELIAFVNARLSNPDANYSANFDIAASECGGRDFSCYIGPTVYLYDPTRACEDGGSECRVARLGNLWLDERLGVASVEDQSLKRFTLRDLAWHPGYGFWSLSYDSLNDEWGFARLDVGDWTVADNRIGVERYAVRAGPVDDPDTDPCYWRFNMTALGFAGQRLYAGSAGAAGELYEVDAEFLLDPRHKLHPNDSSRDPDYYADRVLCSRVYGFSDSRGIVGDVAADRDGEAAQAIIDAQEDDSALPPGRNALYQLADGALGPAGPYFDQLAAGRHIDALARVGGVLYGLDTRGLVYVIEEPDDDASGDWRITQHDDIGALFENPEFDLLIRGATRVVVEAVE